MQDKQIEKYFDEATKRKELFRLLERKAEEPKTNVIRLTLLRKRNDADCLIVSGMAEFVKKDMCRKNGTLRKYVTDWICGHYFDKYEIQDIYDTRFE